MSVAYFESLEDCDLIEVEFVDLRGNELAVRLFVDSGFTGASAFVLSDELSQLALANLSSAHVAGALTGRQRRVLVRCSIPAISFECSLSAILADVGSLSLPPGVRGMVGLSFLRQFRSWGAERVGREAWRFFLSLEDRRAGISNRPR